MRGRFAVNKCTQLTGCCAERCAPAPGEGGVAEEVCKARALINARGLAVIGLAIGIGITYAIPSLRRHIP